MRLTTLGRLALETGDGLATDLPARPRRSAVLVYLACQRVTTREKMLGVFWPDRSPSKGRHALNQTLHVLRQDLGTGWLETHGDQLQATDALTVDIEVFEEAVEAGRWEEALHLYGGRFLDGLYLVDTNEFETWVSAVQRRLEDHHYDAFRRCLAEHGDRDPEAALETAGAWVRAYPHMEEAQYSYVKRLLGAGRPAKALHQWKSYEEQVGREELREPSAAWRKLGERLRDGAGMGPEAEGPPDMEEGRQGTVPWQGTPLRGPRLVRIVDGEEGESFRLRPGETLVGREEGRLTFPEDRRMSGRHAVFKVEGQACETGDTTGARYVSYRCAVRDTGSSNGIYVRIRDDWPLADGDMFAAGEQVFCFQASEQQAR